MKNTLFHHERVYLLGATALLLVFFVQLFLNLEPVLDRADEGYANGSVINLRAGMKAATLRNLLAKGTYYTDPRDIDLVVDSLPARLNRAQKEGTATLDNVGAINKRGLGITVPTNWQPGIGGTDFSSRLRLSRFQMGFDSLLYISELRRPKPYPATVGAGGLTISGTVQDAADTPHPLPDVLVQLRQHKPVPPDTDPSVAAPDRDRLTYARTDATGHFSFAGLTPGAGYSVIPLRPGFEFGTRRGTSSLSRAAEYTFTGRPHTLRPIGSVVYGQLKQDHAFTVRTPGEFRLAFWGVAGGFLLAFWLVHIVWSLRRFHPDALLLPVLMLLTGISVLTLLAIQDPLQDTFYGAEAVQGVAIGLAGMALISQINIGRWYTKWWFDPIANMASRNTFRLTGWTWLLLAVGLAMVMLFIGTGPEGSGVRVNLRIGGLLFQPSELIKYLIILFLAGFFAAHEEQLRNLPDLRWRWRVSVGAFLATGVLMGLYLLLGDMGPAMVVGFTFLLFYTIARNTLGITLLTGLAYGIALAFLPGLLATVVGLLVAVALLLGTGRAKSTTTLGWLALLVEGPMLLLLVIAAFAFGDQIPLVGDRLADRKAMWLSPWNNDVYGGDHLAHSFWTMASGGWTGQGLGKGFANAMPAAHTDMILPSLAEELGWAGLISVFLLLFVLLHRTLLHARRAGQPFSFYLGAGIALATGVQFLLIAGGSLGLLPLTGISVPFLSYGKVSMIINLAAMGVVFAIASRPGLALQHAYIEQHYDPVLATGIIGFLVGTLVLAGKSADVALLRWDQFIVRPARVVGRNGLPVYSYNPRIGRITDALAAGTIFDRAGRVLATSSADTVRRNLAQLRQVGLDPKTILTQSSRRAERYYPFGNQLFFWVGDANTKLFWGQQNGYFAEASHLSDLRGFDNKPRKMPLLTTEYRADRFTAPVQRQITLPVYDYSELAPALRGGLESAAVAQRQKRNRDIRLSVDAGLQVELQKALAESKYNGHRISVVVMDAKSGEVLTSATHPLPNLARPEEMQLGDRERLQLPYLVTERDLAMTYPTAPGSTAKIITATAGMNRLGIEGIKTKYNISCGEIIRRGVAESEPCGGYVDMRTAIVRSSNVYFIRLANELGLDNELAALYLATGMNVDYVGGYSFTDPHTPADRKGIMQHWRDSSFVVRRKLYKDIRYPRRYRSEFSGLAWGQGQLTATPMSMARMAGSVANAGLMQPSRYVVRRAGKPVPVEKEIAVANDSAYANKLRDFMIEQSNANGRSKISISKVAGKTGTPERMLLGEKINDGWYVFFAPTPDGRSHTVTCVRIEITKSSANAVELANTVIAPILTARGYLGSF